MEKEPLLSIASPRKRTSFLCRPSEDDEVILPVSLNQSEFKDYIIFGPSGASPRETTPLVEALTLPFPNSPRNFQPPVPSPLQPSGPSLPCGDSTLHSTIAESSWLLSPSCTAWPKRAHIHRSKTAPAMAAINDGRHQLHATERPQLRSGTVVRQAFLLLLLYLTFGVLVVWLNRDDFVAVETHPIVDALYFCIVTMCTIGYGDITPNSTVGKLFSILFVLVGFGFIDILLTGMVSYMLDMQEGYLLRNVRRGSGEKESSAGGYIIDVKKGRMRIRMKVALALGVVVLCIGIGAGFAHFVEKLGWLDSFYLSVMSVTTVGYGDRAFESLSGRLFASVWLLVSTLAVARAFLYLTEARVDKRNRSMAKWVLEQNMTVSEFLAADIDNNGFVSKSEYVIYKLKEMGKVLEKDILQICQKFERLDTGNCGKITLADLLYNDH